MSISKNKKNIFSLLMILMVLLIIFRKFFNFNFLKKDNLPIQYSDFLILKEEKIKLKYTLLLESKNSVLDTKIILINNTKDYPAYMGLSKIITQRDDGYFLELPGYGEGFDWWKVGDLNNNGFPDVAVLYQNMGSGSFQPFYFYEWNGYNFDVKLHNADLFNRDDLEDLDGDGKMEIIHEFRVLQTAWAWKEIYKWDSWKNEFIKANNLFPDIYKEWIKDKEENPEQNFEISPDFYGMSQGQDMLKMNDCLKEKAILNSKGIFADIGECKNLF